MSDLFFGDETLPLGQQAKEQIDQLILVQTDSKGLVTFQDMANQNQMNYQKINKEPSISNAYESSPLLQSSMMSSHEFFI